MREAPGGWPVRILATLYVLLGGCLAIMLPLTPLMLVSVAIQGSPPGGPEEWPMVLITAVLGFVLGSFGALTLYSAWRLWRGEGRVMGMVVGIAWLITGMWPLGMLALWALIRERGLELEA